MIINFKKMADISLTLMEPNLSETKRLILRDESFSGINHHFTVNTLLKPIVYS